jgi:acyl transferase domain-containing protein
MKKLCVFLGLSFTLWVSPLSADALKNSLTNMLNEKETSSMVDLGNINLNGKAKPIQKIKESRPSNALIATVNGHKIIKKQADTYLKQRTKGKVTNFDAIAPEQQKRLVYELSLPLLVSDAAKKELSPIEKQAVYTRTWMKKEALKTTITDEEALVAYNEITKQAQEHNATSPIPPFESVKDKLKLQMMEKAIIGKLMKDVKIKVL